MLIDGDMRRPQLDRIFDLTNDAGLSNILTQRPALDKARVQKAIQETVIPGLYVLPSGNARNSVSGLLHSDRFRELIDLARGQFDTVVIDTPPMLNIADSQVMARSADAVILVMRSSVTTRDAGLDAKAKFAEDGVPIFGAILNGWNPNTPGYGYYKSYYASNCFGPEPDNAKAPRK